jgi:hypothetical protein
MVVLLGIAKARVLPTGCLPMGFLSLWCNTAAEAAGRFHILVVGAGARGGGCEVAEFAFVTGVEVAVGWVGGMVIRTEVLAPVQTGWGWVGAPQVLPFLC